MCGIHGGQKPQELEIRPLAKEWWELNPSLLQKQQMLLTIVLSLARPHFCL